MRGVQLFLSPDRVLCGVINCLDFSIVGSQNRKERKRNRDGR